MTEKGRVETVEIHPSGVEIIDSISRFEELRREWNELLEASSSACLFLTWEWLFTWWKHFGDGRKLQILAARTDGLLTGLWPLALRTRRPFGFVPVDTVEFLGSGTVGSDYLDVIVRVGHEREALAALAGALLASRVRIVLAQVSRTGSHAGELAAFLGRSGWKATEQVTHVCPYLDLSSHTWDSYLAALGPSHRYNFRRRLRQLTAQHEVKLEIAESERERAVALEELFDLHQRRWTPRGGSDGLGSERLLSFHRELSRIALEQGWLRLVVLRLDGEAAAAVYGFLYRGKYYFYQSGFDPRFAKGSVGLVSIGLCVQQALKDGALEFDFLHGSEAYKFQWARAARPLSRWELYPPHISSRVYKAFVDSARAGKEAARRWAAFMGSAPLPPFVSPIEERKRDAARGY
jgi:CelD/BcsL family acetyltransferase involved in cellulose biosynthesis